MSAELLLKAADILEKTAEYVEQIEVKKVAQAEEEKTKVAQELATKLSATLGEDIDTAVVEKLSGMGSDVQDLVSRLAVGGEVDSLGGPEMEEKVASHSSVDAADARFLNWCNS